MKVMIVNAYGRSNRGDSVLLDECIAEVRAAFPDARISCAVFEGVSEARAVHPDVHWSVRIGNASGPMAKLKTLARMASAGLSTVPGLGWLARALPQAQRDSLRRIRQADMVISAPGGYIHDTNFAYYVALFHIWLCPHGARNILAPQSIGPIDKPLARRVAGWVLNRTDTICARESYSWTFLREELGLPEHLLRRSGDSAFWNHDVTDAAAPEIRATWDEMGLSPEDNTPILGLSVVDWTFPKSPDPEAARTAYVQALSETIDTLVERHGMRAVLFNQVSEDLPMAARIAAACRHPVTIDRTSREPDVLRALIGRSTVFLGTRFHSCIFAMMAGVPTFAIAYLPKTSFILQDLKLAERQVPITDLDSATVTTTFEHDLSDLSAARARINKAVSCYRDTHARLRDVLLEHA